LQFGHVGAHFIGGEREDEGFVDNGGEACRIRGGVRNRSREV